MLRLPDAWSGKGACPVCRSSGSLRVAHQSILPDRMECAVCGTAFEMQSGGPHIRLLVLPGSLRKSNYQHRGMVAALRAGDADGAARLMEQHILDGKARLLRTLTD